MNPAALEHAARLQFLFREVNERIAQLSADVTYDGPKLFVCECSQNDCAEALELGLPEYESVRGDGARFIVVDGHEIEEIERVVERRPRFAVVEKEGHAAELARADDPRRR